MSECAVIPGSGLSALSNEEIEARLVSWSAREAVVRAELLAVLAVATPASEEVWLRLARAGTAEHVDRVVRAFRRVTPADAEHQHTDRRFWVTQDDDGSVLHAKLPAPIGSGIASALRSTVEPARGVPLSARLADRSVDAVTGGAPVVPEVIFHMDAAVLDGEPGLCATVTGHAVVAGDGDAGGV